MNVSKVKHLIQLADGHSFSILVPPTVSRCAAHQQYLTVATVVMILRIWVIYHRSRLVFGILLVFFSLEIIFTTLAVAIESKMNLLGT